MKSYLAMLLVILPMLTHAQLSFEQYKQAHYTKYQEYKSERQKKYDAYRQKLNQDYADYIATKWKTYRSHAALKKPNDMDMPHPDIKQDNTPPQVAEIRYKLVITIVPYEAPDPIVPFSTPPADDKPTFCFSFHGTPCKVHLSDALKYTLSDATEQSVADMWQHLSDPMYDALVSDCLALRKDLQLGDWGYINILQSLTKSFCGSDSNEAVVMQMYILAQSGYSSRMARVDERLVLLVPFEATLYDYSYFYLDDRMYYILDKEKNACSYSVFNKAFPQEQVPSLRMNASPKLAYRAASSRTLSSRRYPGMRSSVAENLNLIDFYNEYPLTTSWDYYSAASLSDQTKQSLYPVLKREIAGKTTQQAANMLINFVQTAFNYQTDGLQFGYERPLYGDETIYYPYSDCEDRSILYSILVRELMGLDVVLLHYPGHLATAVSFPDNKAYGWHFTWNNKVYTICDPTYIGADIGECMPQFQGLMPEVIQIL